jgi:hypothetical protein
MLGHHLARGRAGHILSIGLLVLAGGCGGDDDDDSQGPASTTHTSICTGVGWRDTCSWLMTCSNGRYEVLCSPSSDPELKQAVADAGITLDGTVCACVVDQTVATSVPFDDGFCSDKFDDMDSDRQDKAHAIVNSMCGWTTP